jgi:hypothetical protein
VSRPAAWCAWLAERLTDAAARRLSRSHPDWAEAIRGEHLGLAEHSDQLSWAIGAFGASFVVPGALKTFYPVALAAALTVMTLYQWSADENLLTLLMLTTLNLGLGLISPQRYLVSGILVGGVVAAVLVFETLSGILPGYEKRHHNLLQDLCWLGLLLPTLGASALGRNLGLRLQTQI